MKAHKWPIYIMAQAFMLSQQSLYQSTHMTKTIFSRSLEILPALTYLIVENGTTISWINRVQNPKPFVDLLVVFSQFHNIWMWTVDL